MVIYHGRKQSNTLNKSQFSRYQIRPNYPPVETQVTPILAALLADCPAGLFGKKQTVWRFLLSEYQVSEILI